MNINFENGTIEMTIHLSRQENSTFQNLQEFAI